MLFIQTICYIGKKKIDLESWSKLRFIELIAFFLLHTHTHTYIKKIEKIMCM